MVNFVNKIRAAYKRFPDAATEYDLNYTPKLDQALDGLSSCPVTNFSVETLDLCPSDQVTSLSLALGHLPEKVLMNEFGRDAFVWSLINFPYMRRSAELSRFLCKTSGTNLDLLEQQRLYARNVFARSQASSVIHGYDLVSDLKNKDVSDIDLPKLLRLSTDEGAKLSNEKISRYSLAVFSPREPKLFYGYERTWGNEVIGNRWYTVYLDAPIGIGLMYEGIPSAVVSFGIGDESPESLMIHQLEGIRPHLLGEKTSDGGIPVIGREQTRGLSPLDFRRLLVNLVEEIATQSGFTQVIVKSGHNNKWTREKYSDGAVHLPLERALKIYDDTASRLKYKQRADKNWCKYLKA